MKYRVSLVTCRATQKSRTSRTRQDKTAPTNQSCGSASPRKFTAQSFMQARHSCRLCARKFAVKNRFPMPGHPLRASQTVRPPNHRQQPDLRDLFSCNRRTLFQRVQRLMRVSLQQLFQVGQRPPARSLRLVAAPSGPRTFPKRIAPASVACGESHQAKRISQ
jgi:hypothetical protein